MACPTFIGHRRGIDRDVLIRHAAVVTRISRSPSAPVGACAGLPQPRSSSAVAAATRAAGGASLAPQIPVKVEIAMRLLARANERISVSALGICSVPLSLAGTFL